MAQRSRRDILKATGVTAIGALAGCMTGDDDGDDGTPTSTPEDGTPDEDSIVIGALEPLSGPFSPWAGPHLNGLEFAVDEVNADGGVLGRDLELVTADSEAQASAADTAFRRMVEQQGAVAIAGPASSDVGIRTAGTAEELEVPLYLHMSGSEAVINEDSRYTFRASLLPAATTMAAQAELVADADYASIGAIVGDYEWGYTTRDHIEQEFGVDVHIEVAPVDASDFKPYIRRMPQDLEMMIATGHPPGAFSIANQLYQLDYSPEVITGSGAPPHVVLDALGDHADDAYTEVHMTDFTSEAFVDVATRYAEETGEQMGPHVSYGYVAGKLIAQAIEDAGEADPTAIAEATRNIEFDTLYPEPIQYTEYGELKDQVQLYSQLELEGPEHFPDGDYRYEEVYRTDPLPALPADG